MSNRIIYTTLSLYPDIADRIVKVKEAYKPKNNNEAVQVLLKAFDIINGTGHGGDLSAAAKSVYEKEREK